MGDIFGPDEVTTTQRQTFQLPGFVEAPLQRLISRGEQLSQTPREMFPGSLIPSRSPLTQQGIGALGQAAGLLPGALGVTNQALTGALRPGAVGLQDVVSAVPGSAVSPLVPGAQSAFQSAIGGNVPGIGRASFDQGGLGPIPSANFMGTAAPSVDFTRAVDAAVSRALPGIQSSFGLAGGRNDPLASAAVADVASRAGVEAAQNQFSADLARANFLQGQIGRQFGADTTGFGLGLQGRQFLSDQAQRQFQSDLQRQQALAGQSLARGQLAQFPLAQATGERGQLLGLQTGLLGQEQGLQESAIARQLQAAQGLPGLLQGFAAPLLQAGGIDEARAAAQQAEEAARFEFGQNEPRQRLGEFAGLFQGLAPLAGGTTVGTTTQPVFSSPLAQIAGLGLAGASLFGGGGPLAGVLGGLGGGGAANAFTPAMAGLMNPSAQSIFLRGPGSPQFGFLGPR